MKSIVQELTLITIIFILFGLFLIKYLWDNRKFYHLSWIMPGPPWPLPIIGNALIFLDHSDTMLAIETLIRRYGAPFRFWLGTRFVIIFNQPKHIEIILNSSATTDKGMVYECVHQVLGGHGLFSSAGQEWKTHRKLLNPTIQHFSILNSFYPIFNRNLRILMDKLNNPIFTELNEFNIYTQLEACSLDMICETTFGTKMNIQENENLKFLEAANNMMHVAGILIFQPWLQIPWIFNLTKYAKILNESTLFARSFATEILQSKIKKQTENLKNLELNNNNNNNNGTNEVVISKNKKPLNIFVDECMKLLLEEKCFTNDDVVNESLTMLVGGFETTATTVSYIVLMLAMFPDYQNQVFEEIHELFPEQSSDVTSEDLAKLNFTNRFIKESMRVNPTVPFVARTVQTNLEIDKYEIPAGSDLILNIFNMQRNLQLWNTNANTFDPDNFLPEKLQEKHPYAFIPFSAGPRNCIGLKYGNIVIRLFICWLVRHYRFSTTLKLEDLKYRMSVTLKLDNKHMVRVYRRHDY